MSKKKSPVKRRKKSIKLKAAVVETKNINNRQYTTLISEPLLLNVRHDKNDKVKLGDRIEVKVGYTGKLNTKIKQ